MLEQSEQNATFNASIRIGIDHTIELAKQIRQKGDAIEDGSRRIVTALEHSATNSTEEHKKTQCAIEDVSNRFRGQSDEVILLAKDVIEGLKTALQENREQHADTLKALWTSRQEGLKQTQDLTQEIRSLQAQVGEALRQIAIRESLGQISLEEEQQLRNASSAKQTLRLAKELVLSKILVCLLHSM